MTLCTICWKSKKDVRDYRMPNGKINHMCQECIDRFEKTEAKERGYHPPKWVKDLPKVK